MRHKLICLLAALSFANPAWCKEPVLSMIPDAEIVGEGTLSMAFWDVYQAKLYAPSGTFSDNQPFALSIYYMRNIEGGDIADRSIEEIRGQGFSEEAKLSRWNSQMKKIFPNVRDGTVLLAIFIPDNKTIFYNGNQKIGTINDAEFTKWFSNIWLSEKTSAPELRRNLLGMS